LPAGFGGLREIGPLAGCGGLGHVDGVRHGLNNIDGPNGKRELFQGLRKK
jgi:hypothetical protein